MLSSLFSKAKSFLPSKRFLVDWAGNYFFFVPVIILLNAPFWPVSAMVAYAVTSVFVAAIVGRAFTVFLKRWYRLFNIEF